MPCFSNLVVTTCTVSPRCYLEVKVQAYAHKLFTSTLPITMSCHYRHGSISVRLTLWDSTRFQPPGTAQTFKVLLHYIRSVIRCIGKSPKILVKRAKNDQNLNLMVRFWNKLCSISLLLQNYWSERDCLLVLSTISGRQVSVITSN